MAHVTKIWTHVFELYYSSHTFSVHGVKLAMHMNLCGHSITARGLLGSPGGRFCHCARVWVGGSGIIRGLCGRCQISFIQSCHGYLMLCFYCQNLFHSNVPGCLDAKNASFPNRRPRCPLNRFLLFPIHTDPHIVFHSWPAGSAFAIR